jgi:hypothetical protein
MYAMIAHMSMCFLCFCWVPELQFDPQGCVALAHGVDPSVLSVNTKVFKRLGDVIEMSRVYDFASWWQKCVTHMQARLAEKRTRITHPRNSHFTFLFEPIPFTY